MPQWFAGIDWSDDHHDLVILDSAGVVLTSRRISHTPEGIHELLMVLEAVCGEHAKSEIACIIETTHGLLITALVEAGFAVYPVNPKILDRRRSPSGLKTDHVDAYLLAKVGRSEIADLRRLCPDSPLIQELKRLTRDQERLIQDQTRLTNQLTACLKAYFPVALQLFLRLYQPTTLAFLAHFPTPQTARAATADAVSGVLRAAGHRRLGMALPHSLALLQRP